MARKDALSGVILPVTSKYDVPLMVARGYASLSFLSEAAQYMEAEKRPVFIYHLGDFDHRASTPASRSSRHCGNSPQPPKSISSGSR